MRKKKSVKARISKHMTKYWKMQSLLLLLVVTVPKIIMSFEFFMSSLMLMQVQVLLVLILHQFGLTWCHQFVLSLRASKLTVWNTVFGDIICLVHIVSRPRLYMLPQNPAFITRTITYSILIKVELKVSFRIPLIVLLVLAWLV